MFIVMYCIGFKCVVPDSAKLECIANPFKYGVVCEFIMKMTKQKVFPLCVRRLILRGMHIGVHRRGV